MCIVLLNLIGYAPMAAGSTVPYLQRIEDGFAPMALLQTWAFLPTAALMFLIAVVYYRKTGRIYLGAIIVAVMGTWIMVVGTVLFTVEDRLNKDMINDATDDLLLKFVDDGLDISGFQFTLYDDTLDRAFFDADAGAIDKMGTIFGVIGIIICSVMIFNTLHRMIQSQNKNIGLFLAMGSPRKKIIFHYIKIAMLLTIIGCIIGIPLGYVMAIGMVKVVVQMYSIHYFDYTMEYDEFIYGSIAVLGIGLIFAIISSYPITKVTPREAMTAVFNRIKVTKSTLGEKLFGWLPMFKTIHMRIPLREIFLRKKRSIFTILAITTSMVILINSVAMVYNMFTQVDANFTEYNTADVKVVLQDPVPISQINQFMEDEDQFTINSYETYIDLYTKINHEGEFLTWAKLEAYQENSTLRKFNVIEGNYGGKEDLSRNKIIMGQSLAGKYDLELDDEIQIGLLANLSVDISGLVGEMVDYSVFWSLESFQTDNVSAYFGLPKNYVNGFLLDVPKDTDLEALRAKVETGFEVSQWNDSEV